MADYVDIDYSMEKNEYSTINFVEDAQAIKQSMIDILLTIVGERGEYEPMYGSKLYYILFEKINQLTALQIKDEILNALTTWEPRIRVYEINVFPYADENFYDITINFEILRLAQVEELTLKLEKM